MKDTGQGSSIEESIKKAQIIYGGLGNDFEKQNNGKYIAIEIGSSEYCKQS